MWIVENPADVVQCLRCHGVDIIKSKRIGFKNCQKCQNYRSCLRDGMQHCFRWFNDHMTDETKNKLHEFQTLFFKLFAENCKDYERLKK